MSIWIIRIYMILNIGKTNVFSNHTKQEVFVFFDGEGGDQKITLEEFDKALKALAD